MKYIKWVLALIVVILFVGVPLTVSAINSELVTEELSNEEILDLTKKVEFLKITSHSPLVVNCFDVRDDHMIVIGSDAGDTAVLAVYDDCGNFQYGFEKEKLGSFRVMWSENEIAYYSIRSALLFKIDKDGEIIDIRRVANTMENSIYDRDVLQSTTRTVDGITYHMTNDRTIVDALLGSYKKITKTDVAGTTVIYDASKHQHTTIMSGFVIFGLISIFIASSIIMGIKKHCKKVRDTRNTGDGSVC